MLDPFDRTIDYLRISVVDRCDLRCVYCMGAEGVEKKRHEDILSYEQIEQVVQAAAGLGFRKVRLTGGEPLIRRGITCLVEKLAAVDGIEDLCMTTNGTRLAGMAQALKAAGLNRVNVSLDTLEADRFREITRGGDIRPVLEGIDAAVGAGLTPVKINMVIFEDTTEDEVATMQEFCRGNGLTLQKIMQFSLYDRKDLKVRFRSERPPRCKECNRLRLTADGYFKPCLFSEQEIPVDFGDIEGSIRAAVAAKPRAGSRCANRSMRQIGG